MKRLVKALGASAAVVTAWLAMTAVAGATTALDDVGTQFNSTKTDLTSFLITYAIPAVFGLVLIGVVVRLGIKYSRKAGGAA